jgi:hypothetical protein
VQSIAQLNSYTKNEEAENMIELVPFTPEQVEQKQ